VPAAILGRAGTVWPVRLASQLDEEDNSAEAPSGLRELLLAQENVVVPDRAGELSRARSRRCRSLLRMHQRGDHQYRL